MFAKKLAIIGSGYVGLELAQVLSRGHSTNAVIIAYDINLERAEYVNSITAGNVIGTNDPNMLMNADAFMICVPTPDDAYGRPDERPLYQAKALVEKYSKKDSIMILESSVCVGDTRKIFGNLRDKDIFVAFSPERVDPGRVFPPPHTIAKLLGGIDKESYDKALEVYSPAFDNIVYVSSPEVAEFSKLYENTFRLMNIAFANQVADAAKNLGLNPDEIYDAVNTKPFGLSGPFKSGLGAGGPCLPSNAKHLLHTCDIPLLKSASEACSERPRKQAWNFANFAKDTDIKKVLVSGLSFKKNVSTTIASPALAFAYELSKLMHVVVHDPLVPKNNDLNFTSDLVSDLKSSDCVILLVDHDHPDTAEINKYASKMLWSP
ncbi:UDP-N-acetyl-D-mannosamine dehydrogenase / UDP-glucose 6-dehydrogenase [Paramecium bursaria Chlorella virus CVR-1]|uniref:UDP-N-acetyl-D-mannosamine dehydrogenase / UDP-glucose 6-dehydrogenase n=1 Tax=Paramecium bursaria Chlorella virus CVA-1 TaxID=42683 RepID=M1HF05_9PHYC|nr:UDP-glucose dehydrogenase [Paramecium bursaria Chlorella virus CVA-1]AGE48715.1 UDP-N-acetyl-D-mannosamine dehydrogenase / UDP-glucose 6-dehydrogenase [Paramecium bursaria Chlorella virus AP110A]AGE50402.1 UDP-N-acetyl-D-mannosamine dehydrogenase / UDP-glucose 6-dehydrogenase [Paramecium bursaria Chlorella virus CVA-1]AGE52079.1 UDP-N-acetyl-D-mannosamine dehydrogenase / UDP-glucose 6-dehydrogenase [Paramecium bursaria Chlorella virus CVR-1]